MNKTANSKLTPNAKNLRKNMTKEERHLWYDFLKNQPVTFHRQKVIGNYIVDFYCATAKIVIELDGSQHFTAEGKRHDEIRTRFLESQNIQVLRYSNATVMKNLQGVCSDIDRVVRQRVESFELTKDV